MNGVEGTAPIVSGGWMRGVAGGGAIEIVIAVCAARAGLEKASAQARNPSSAGAGSTDTRTIFDMGRLLVSRQDLANPGEIRSQSLVCSNYGLFVTGRQAKGPRSNATLWRQRSFEVLKSSVVAGHAPGPEPPAAWQAHLRQLVDASRAPVEGPRWWTPGNAYFGNVETRTDPQAYRWDGMKRLGPGARPLAF